MDPQEYIDAVLAIWLAKYITPGYTQMYESSDFYWVDKLPFEEAYDMAYKALKQYQDLMVQKEAK
jgi:hypothetical protein